MIGRTIGKYRIVAQLGRGGAGIVYKAVDETLNRDVAVKTLNPDLANTEVMSRFRAEATILARLNHPPIATIYELFRSEADLLMVMEFVRGETLDKLSERLGPIAPDRAAYLIDLVLTALQHAHRAGIVHRDVKPANVMVTDEGSIKIMDFGIARVLGAEQKTVDFRLMGTPAYMSPEQVMGEEVDGRSDLYSVGVLFYRLLTGALPFTADTALGMLQRQIRDTPTPLCVHRPSLPEWCDRIVQRALAKTPADRFQSAEEFRDALDRAIDPLHAFDLAESFARSGKEAAALPAAPGPPPDMIDLSRHDAAEGPPTAIAVGSPSRTGRTAFTFAHATVVALAFVAVAFGYLALQRGTTATLEANATSVETRPASAPEASLVFETKALVGTRRAKEQSAQLVLGEGKITIIPQDSPTSRLCSFPYGQVISISVSRSRDPLWNSPQGPAPVSRAGVTLNRPGIQVSRNWIALRTSTDEHFVAMRFDEVLLKRVLLALEERTGHTPQVVVMPEDEKGK